MRRTIARVAGASALGAVLVLGGIPGIAQAATTKCAYHGYDRACATNYSTYSSLEVCDNEADGHGVVGWFASDRYPDVSIGIEDTNGSSTGCGRTTWERVDSFVICENGEGCSGRIYM